MERALVVLVLAVAAAGVIAVLSLGLHHAAPRVKAIWRALRTSPPPRPDAFTVAQRIRADRRRARRRPDLTPRCRSCGYSHPAWQGCPDQQEPA